MSGVTIVPRPSLANVLCGAASWNFSNPQDIYAANLPSDPLHTCSWGPNPPNPAEEEEEPGQHDIVQLLQ